MNRKTKLLLNSISGLTKQLVTVICGFIIPRIILKYYGSDTNGLVTSITNFLSLISLLDMGVGAVIQANLYKPLASNDNYTTSTIIASSQVFFRRLAFIFLAYIVVLAAVYPKTINSDFDYLFTAALVLIISISTFAQYYFGMTNELLLCADQRSFIPTSMQVGTLLLNTICSIVMMKAGASIHAVKLVTAAIYLFRPIGQSIYIKYNYTIDRHVKYEGEPIKQKWNGLAQHFAAVVCDHIDVVLLSFFSSMGNVSVYSVYAMVTNGITMIIMTATNGVEALLGNMIAKGEELILNKTFATIEWVIHALTTVVFSTAAILIVPFVLVYTNGIADANYNTPLFGAILVTAYAVRCLRVPYFMIVKAAGHFKETQNGAFISALLNILVSVTLIFKFGLVGIAFGTFVAMFYHTCYFMWYLKKHILNRSPKHFLFYLLSDVLSCVIIVLITLGFDLESLTYGSWIIMALKTVSISVAVTLVVNVLFYRARIRDMLELLKSRSRR